MAKNESTAVNELIQLVATQKPLPPDPSEDLMFREPAGKRAKPSHQQQVGIATMQGFGPPATPPVPPRPPAAPGTATMQGLGAVVRAPAVSGTSLTPESAAVRVAAAISGTSLTPEREMASAEVTPAGASASDLVPEAPVLPVSGRRTRAATEPPVATPVAAPFETEAPVAVAGQPALAAGAPAVALPVGHELAPVTLEMTPSEKWYARSSKLGRRDEAFIGTIHVRNRRPRWKTAARLAAPMAIALAIGVLVGGYFMLDGRGGKAPDAKAATPAAKADTAPAAVKAPATAKDSDAARAAEAAAAAKAAPAQVAAPAPAEAVSPPASTALPSKFVDVMVTSSPAGATVTLVDRGKTSFIGTTPVSTALDASRTYELVFSYPNRPTQIEPLDPSQTRRVDVTLGRAATAAGAKPAPPHEPVTANPARVVAAPPASEAKPARAKPGRAESKSEPTPAATSEVKAELADAKPPAPGGDGTLMISSKPPCEIYIDGKATGLTTPQRSISLPSGTHRITLVNNVEGLKKTIAVSISPGETTKVIQDLMTPAPAPAAPAATDPAP